MDHIGPKAAEKVLFRDIWKRPGRPKTRFNRNDIHSEWLAIRNGCGTTPKGPIGPFPEAHKAPLPNVPLIPTTAGPLAQQLPRALFPKGTREARLKLYMCTIFGKQGIQKRPIGVAFSASKGTQKRASEYHLSRARLQAPSKEIKPFARVSLNKFFLSLFKTSVG